MPIYHVHAANLEPYTTTEANWKSGRTKLPPSAQLTDEEDIFKTIIRKKSTTEELDHHDNYGEKEFAMTLEDMLDKRERRRIQLRRDIEIF